jgi:putative ABC transport system permease protein
MHSDRAALTLLRIAARHLYRRPMRTTLTALGVAVGVVAIVSLSMIVGGLWEAVDNIVHINDTELMVFQANISVDIFSILDEEETREKLLSVPGVNTAVGALWHILRIRPQPYCLSVGLRLEDMEVLGRNLTRGRIPTADDEMLLGSIAQRVFDKDVGETLRIHGEPYRVVGVYHTNVIFFNGGITLSLPRLQQLAAKNGQVTVFQVDLDPDADPAAVTELIESTYPELVAVSGANEYEKADQGLIIAQSMVWTISFIAIVVGSIIVANTMWMAVMERTREIGVLRAVGWSRRRIVFMIMVEAAGVGLIACAVGCLLGAGLAKLAAIMPVAELYIEPAFDAGPFLLAFAVAILLSVIGALVPAWRAAHISPAEALRYE